MNKIDEDLIKLKSIQVKCISDLYKKYNLYRHELKNMRQILNTNITVMLLLLVKICTKLLEVVKLN